MEVHSFLTGDDLTLPMRRASKSTEGVRMRLNLSVPEAAGVWDL
jgi:hypothetical protein